MLCQTLIPMMHVPVVMFCQAELLFCYLFSLLISHMWPLSHAHLPLLFLILVTGFTIHKLLHCLPTSFHSHSVSVYTYLLTYKFLHTYFLFNWCDPFLPSLTLVSFSGPPPLRLLGPLTSPLTHSNNCCPGSYFWKGLLVRKSAKVAEKIIGSRVGVQMHGCWAWGDQVASQGFPGLCGRRGWAELKAGAAKAEDRPSPAARQQERTQKHSVVWELPVGHTDLDNQLRHVQGLLNRTAF